MRDALVALVGDGEKLVSVWDQDETIGWVYQYFTPKELRERARSESSAPRNAYELAFRNQFYTPRYVVRFLTENTLGRLWYEMRRGQTELIDACPYLVYRPNEVFLAPGDVTSDQPDSNTANADEPPVYVPHRPKKDPREIRVLDPACSSGHFLLYCFDLLERIYEEAYADADLGPDLQAEYGSYEAFERAVPQLILRHNLHGIDIDLRATQIAGLALWLRAQRFFAEREIPRDDRPPIRRANVVCAEPMPGETSMLEEFLQTLDGDRLRALVSDALELAPDQAPQVTATMAESLRNLVRTVWGQMELVSEAGSLLKVDEALQAAIDDGRREWEEQLPLLRMTELSLTEQPKEHYYRFIPEDVNSFWTQAERIVDVALRDYIEHATNGRDYQRRLFAEDALQGFAFIDLCRRSYDVVLMNPPFGKPSKPSKAYVDKTYPRTKNDVYAAFVERGLGWLQPGGLLGAITSRTGFFLSSFQKWREEILLGEAHPTVVADLGYGVLDTAMVETAAYCLAKP
ncbi:MAG: Eco57I restriction-modification methylase domain-containing protein [Candidatus Bipolaricaulia bacterium]